MTTGGIKEDKQKLFQAFQQLRAERKKLDSKIATKQESAEKEKNQEILTAAASYTIDSIVKGLADLQLDFASIVHALAEKLAKENAKLDELNRGIEIATQQLQELQEIRIVADTLDILTQEHQEKLKLLEQETANKREVLQKATIVTRKEWQKEQLEFDQKLQAYNNLLTKQRQQEEEGYQYELVNKQKIATDEYEYKKRNLEREISESSQEKEKNWQEREKILTQNKSLLTEYQQKAALFPNELEEAIKKAREEAIRDTNQRAKVEADLFEKEWEATKQSYELKITSLEATINQQAEQIAGISTQLQTALTQAQDLAMKAFSGSSSK